MSVYTVKCKGLASPYKTFLSTLLGLQEAKSKDAFYLSWDLTDQTIPVAMIILVLIKFCSLISQILNNMHKGGFSAKTLGKS